MDGLIGAAVMLATPAYLVLQVIALLMTRSMGWRFAALAPLLFSVPIALYCIYAFGAGSNLWPLPFILFAPLGAGYLVVVVALYFGQAALRGVADRS